MAKMKTIPQRELRNRIGRALREVEQGRPMRITVDGRPVADLVPVGGVRRTMVARGLKSKSFWLARRWIGTSNAT
jgi:prevent-host-death family protein